MSVNDKQKMKLSDQIPQAILDLVDNSRKLNTNRLWQTLTDDEKRSALTYAVGSERTRDAMAKIVADARRFRERTVAGWDNEKIVKALIPLSLPLPIPGWLFLGLWIGQEGASRVFLDALGVPNDDGFVEGESYGEDATEESVHAAIDRVRRVFDIRSAVLFTLTLICQGNVLKDSLWQWTRNAVKIGADDRNDGQDISGVEDDRNEGHDWSDVVSIGGDGSADLTGSRSVNPTGGVVAEGDGTDGDGSDEGDGEADQANTEQDYAEQAKRFATGVFDCHEGGDSMGSGESDLSGNGQPEHETRALRLTELDRLVNNAIIDARNGVTGGLRTEQSDEIVDELTALNAARVQSSFHKGFADAVFGRSPARRIGADANRWYWAGVVRGKAYLSDHNGIIQHFDENAIVRSLGDGKDAASDEAAIHVVQALRKAERHAETADFVEVAALRDPEGELFGDLLEIGTDLLRGERPGEARMVFALLMDAESMLRNLGFAHEHIRFLTVRRRQAHTLRKLHEHEQAKKLLRDILEMNPNPEIRAMISADLGLLEGGFAELEEVCLPLEQDGVGDFLERLRAGERMFRESIRNEVEYSGHGHYCLGALALADGDYASAAFHLERARGLFNSRKLSYGATLAGRADLYVGIAKAALAESVGDLSYAVRIIINAMASGTPLPTYMIRPAAEGLELLGSAEIQSGFCAAVLESDQGAVLDVFVDLDAAMSTKPVTQALRQRALKLGKTESAAADLHRCFEGCMKAGRHEDARTVLDELEVLAIGGVGEAAFHDLLMNTENLQPAWERDEAVIAQVRCLESKGNLENAMSKAVPLFHEALTMGNIDEARGIYENMHTYGLPDSHYQEVKSRLDGVIRQYESAETGQDDSASRQHTRPVRVLFVGGDENQQKLVPVVQEQLKKRAPHVEVQFIFPGWSGNWPPHLERVKKELEGHDVVVLLRFMRTHLGREIRKACQDTPWRSCWPSGAGGITESIISAAESV